MAVAAMLWTMLFCCAARGQSPDGATVQPNKLRDQVTTSKAAEAAETQAADAQVLSKGDDFDNRLIDGGTTQTEDTSSDTGDDRRWNLSVLDILWPLLAVLAGIVLLFWAARKYLPGVQRLTGSAAVEVLARTHLAPRQSINVVRRLFGLTVLKRYEFNAVLSSMQEQKKFRVRATRSWRWLRKSKNAVYSKHALLLMSGERR